MKNILSKSLIIVFVLFPIFFVSAEGLKVGIPAPDFKVISGNGEELTLDVLKGKVAVLFYETKNTVEQNRRLKNNLNIFYANQSSPYKKEILRIGVINCQGVLFKSAWEKGLRDNSLKEGITIYGDWDGKMFASYQVKQDISNIIIIDREGIVRYYASGQVEDKDIVMIEELLKGLLEDK